MPAPSYPYNYLRGLSDFWTRFFADADQLDNLYQGTAVMLGQAYLDLMSAALGVCLKDAIALDCEYYRLITLREDQIRYVAGDVSANARWAFTLPEPVVQITCLDNQAVEPTASLEPQRDFEVDAGTVYFKQDPTDPTGAGLPVDGYARRALDVAVGGSFVDASVVSWSALSVKKGDVLRILDGTGPTNQRKRADYGIVLVRPSTLYTDAALPFAQLETSVTYAVLRTPADNTALDSVSFTGPSPAVATLSKTRVDQGSLRLYAKNAAGADVVEGVDYLVDYEGDGTNAKLYQLTSGWSPGPYGVAYTWKTQVATSTLGQVARVGGTTRVVQMAAWAPDVRVDRRTLANNFGTLIGREAPSTEQYRAFLAGIFQLYLSGPVLERVESALNVVLGLPVVRDDGETVIGTDLTDPDVDRVLTSSPTTGSTVVYEFPKGTPLRADLVSGLVLASFEVLTTVVTVTDYVQTPTWWHGDVIPRALFSGTVPDIGRRTATPAYISHTIGSYDLPEIGDPGLYVGADENGFVPSVAGVPAAPSSQPILRRRLAFVLMDRYLKYHTFTVTFDALFVSATLGTEFSQGLTDLNELVISARPAHTFPFTTPTSTFTDTVTAEDGIIDLNWVIGSAGYGPDQLVVQDAPPVIDGPYAWLIGDYAKYQTYTTSTAFPAANTPVTLTNAPAAPRRRRLVRVYVAGAIGGRRLVENVDYAVNYTTCAVTRLTAWDATTVSVTYVQLSIGNLATAAMGADDMPLLLGGVDPAHISADFALADVSVPATAAELAQVVGYGTWTVAYEPDVTSSPIAPLFGSRDMTVFATPTFGVSGPLTATNKGITWRTGTFASTTSSAYYNVGAGDDLALLWVARQPSSLLTSRNRIVGKAGTGGGYVIDAFASGSGPYIDFRLSDGVDLVTVSAGFGSAFVGDWHVGMAVLDRSTNKIRAGTRSLSTNVAYISAEVDASTLGGITTGGALLLAPIWSADWTLAYVGLAIGAGAAAGLGPNLEAALSNFVAKYPATGQQWDGTTTPMTSPRDMGIVERALMVYAHP